MLLEDLPQALKISIPPVVNSFISLFKDTSLVSIVSLYELTGALDLAVNADANWKPFKLQGYFFIALIYFLFCFSMSRYSLWIEKRLNRSTTRCRCGAAASTPSSWRQPRFFSRKPRRSISTTSARPTSASSACCQVLSKQ